MADNINKMIGEIFSDIAEGLESGSFMNRVKIGLTTLGSEHGIEEMIKAAEMATLKYKDFEVVLIGPKIDSKLKQYEANDECRIHVVMEKLLDSGEIQGCVTCHYNFPIGVSTVGRVLTPGRGKEMILATTTGTSSTNRVEAMVKNAIYGIITAKAIGKDNPTVGILNLDGARQVERALKELDSNGYKINFAESVRADGGSIMRGNDLLAGTPDIMVTDTLTGNLLVKVFSSYTTGGEYESIGFGYGPGIGDGYKRLVNIISRASGAPLVAKALRYCATCAQNNIMDISEKEFKLVKKAGYEYVLGKITQPTVKEDDTDVVAPPKNVVTFAIAGVDILELEDAVKALWRKGIYAESGMGCTGPIVMVSDDEGEKSKVVLFEDGFLS
jgi:glycine/sarcosine/betaine reductase complex component C subunit alpha